MNKSYELDSQAINCESKARNKEMLFAEIATIADRAYGLNAAMVENALKRREELGTTGFGQGVAIPHARIEGIERTVCIIIRPLQNMDYASVDDEPVDFVCALLSPLHGGAVHLQALAEASRMLRNEKMLAKLRTAQNADIIFALIDGHDQRNAA